MIYVSDTRELREQIKSWRGQGESIAFVPTMGNLHEGHLELVRLAKQKASRCVVSIFVNPMQFGEGEDFESYPRTFDRDSQLLIDEGTDLLFSPTVETLYPSGKENQTRVEVPGISDILCGASRPGHFIGVATVVCKLFNLVLPDRAIFGEKDFQQLMVIRRMAKDLCMPVEIIGMTTVREKDGLARSSRNGYLTETERQLAPALYKVMNQIAERLAVETDFEALESDGNRMLEGAGFTPDYFTIRRASDLSRPADGDNELVILAAAYLGKARLIDNITVSL